MKTIRTRTVIIAGPSVSKQAFRRIFRRKFCRRIEARDPVPGRDFVIGVDGGIGLLDSIGVKPDLIIGDWDSANRKVLARLRASGVKTRTLSRKKDFSDLHFALNEAANTGALELVLFGVTGGRPDHHLSGLFEIAAFAATHTSRTRFKKIAAIGPEAEYHFVTHHQTGQTEKNSFQLDLPPGTLVSTFALGAANRKVTEGVSMEGFEYNIRGQDLKPSSRGLSNVVRAGSAGSTIRVRKGVLLVVIPSLKSGPHAD